MSNVLRSLVIKVGVDLSNAHSGLTKLSKDLKSTGKSITSTGESMTKGITMPAVAAVTGLTALAVKSGAAADELLTLSAKTGISAKELQKMEYAARFIDTELETMTSSMVKLTKSMDNANKARKTKKKPFRNLACSTKTMTAH